MTPGDGCPSPCGWCIWRDEQRLLASGVYLWEPPQQHQCSCQRLCWLVLTQLFREGGMSMSHMAWSLRVVVREAYGRCWSASHTHMSAPRSRSALSEGTRHPGLCNYMDLHT